MTRIGLARLLAREIEEESRKPRLFDDDGCVAGIDPAHFPFALFFPGGQGRGYVERIDAVVHQLEMGLAARAVHEGADRLLTRLAGYAGLQLRLDPRCDVILPTLHWPALRHGPPAGRARCHEADLETALEFPH